MTAMYKRNTKTNSTAARGEYQAACASLAVTCKTARAPLARRSHVLQILAKQRKTTTAKKTKQETHQRTHIKLAALATTRTRIKLVEIVIATLSRMSVAPDGTTIEFTDKDMSRSSVPDTTGSTVLAGGLTDQRVREPTWGHAASPKCNRHATSSKARSILLGVSTKLECRPPCATERYRGPCTARAQQRGSALSPCPRIQLLR